MKKPLIMKFGGASVAEPKNFRSIAEIIALRAKEYPLLGVVVSAMGNTTDQLLELAKQVHPNPPTREQDMLVSVGERISIALLAMALSLKGSDAISFTGSQSGIITNEDHSDAKIIDVRPSRILKAFDQGRIAIVAGFQGVSRQGEITTLGRGGSDTTAVALAVALGAERVEFYKDVGGIYDRDPKKDSTAKLLSRLTYQEASHLTSHGAKVLHPRCVALAEKNGVQLHVLPFSSMEKAGSVVGWNANRASESVFELG
jgi:aspartate kinase